MFVRVFKKWWSDFFYLACAICFNWLLVKIRVLILLHSKGECKRNLRIGLEFISNDIIKNN